MYPCTLDRYTLTQTHTQVLNFLGVGGVLTNYSKMLTEVING